MNRMALASVAILMALGAPAAKGKPVVPRIEIDCSQAPECRAFAMKAQALCEEWYPRINEILNGQGAALPYGKVHISFGPVDGAGSTSANHIRVSADWVAKKAPNDYGMVIHELTHVVQDYRGMGVGWLTEGIADYIRDRHFEPGVRKTLVTARNSYRDGYGTTAAFLSWLEKTKDPQIVRKLNAASRAGSSVAAVFREATGKTLDELWKDFVQSLKGRP